MRCERTHLAFTEATGIVRYVDSNGVEVLSGPMCDFCQVAECRRLRSREVRGEISEVSTVPPDYRERMAEIRRTGFRRRLRLDIERHPGGPGEIADDLFNIMIHLGADYTVPALIDLVGARISQWQAEQDEGRAMMAAEIDPEEVF